MDKKQNTTTTGTKVRLTKEQLEAIKGGIERGLPSESTRPLYYTVPPSYR